MGNESPFGQGGLSSPLQGGMNVMGNPSIRNPMESLTNLVTKLPDQPSGDFHSGTRTENVLSSFLQNPLQKEGSQVVSYRTRMVELENTVWCTHIIGFRFLIFLFTVAFI